MPRRAISGTVDGECPIDIVSDTAMSVNGDFAPQWNQLLWIFRGILRRTFQPHGTHEGSSTTLLLPGLSAHPLQGTMSLQQCCKHASQSALCDPVGMEFAHVEGGYSSPNVPQMPERRTMC
jgi:hypothetical protein